VESKVSKNATVVPPPVGLHALCSTAVVLARQLSFAPPVVPVVELILGQEEGRVAEGPQPCDRQLSCSVQHVNDTMSLPTGMPLRRMRPGASKHPCATSCGR
jgi:hypothetical protein